jgi:hypothetical protein
VERSLGRLSLPPPCPLRWERAHRCSTRSRSGCVGARRSSRLARAARLAARCVVRSSPRRRVDGEHRQRLLRRNAVSSLNVALGGGSSPSRPGCASRAAIQSMACLPARRIELARVGHRPSVRTAMSNAPPYWIEARAARFSHKPYDRKRVRRDLHDARTVSEKLSAALRRARPSQRAVQRPSSTSRARASP